METLQAQPTNARDTQPHHPHTSQTGTRAKATTEVTDSPPLGSVTRHQTNAKPSDHTAQHTNGADHHVRAMTRKGTKKTQNT